MLLLSYIAFDLSFISPQFLVLNIDGRFVVSSNRFIIFWYSVVIHYYYYQYYYYYYYYHYYCYQSSFNHRLSIIFCLNSWDIYFSPSISSFVSELLCSEVFEGFAILSAILFPIKSPVGSAVFWMNLFEEVLSASVADCLA